MPTDDRRGSDWTTCAACGTISEISANFCGQCGRSLRPPPSDASSVIEGEWRQVTVLFCDLVGSTSLSVDLTPEDLSDLTLVYRQTCTTAIRAHGGSIGSFEGDGIIAYFGYPRAHEDSAVRACRAGLAIIEAFDRRRAIGPRLQVRVACATGLVVIADSDKGADRPTITGTAPNLAARLQAMAPPGALVVSDDTWMLIQDFFEGRELGTRPVKGLPAPIRLWRVEFERSVESRFSSREHRWRQPHLIGRTPEFAALLDRWSAAKSGAGQIVLITGEAGIGKSRLVQTLRERLRTEPCTTMLYQCTETHSGSSLHPVIAQIQFAAGITVRDAPDRKLAKLEALLGADEHARSVLLPLLADLMDLQEAPPLPSLPPQQKRIRTLAALGDRLARLALDRPVLLVIEDVHWSDPTTRELIERTAARLENMRVLVLITSREDDGAGWLRGQCSTHLRLSRLDQADCEKLVLALTGKTLPGRVLAAIAARTNGIPLFVEELTRAILESPFLIERDREFVLTGDLPLQALPTTLRGCLMERLDLLPAGKDVLQLGAVLGQVFSLDVLARVTQRSAESLRTDLQALVSAGLLTARPDRDAQYGFRHALIHDVAYDSLLPRTRRGLHAKVAAVLRAEFDVAVTLAPELLARHLSGGEAYAEAAHEWQRAGTVAAQRSAVGEAILHFEKALSMLSHVAPAERNRASQLDILLHLAGALRASRGYAALETARVSKRALKLARTLGDNIGELHALTGLYSFHLVRSEYGLAEKRARSLLTAATRGSDATYIMVGHRALGTVSFHIGRLKPAEDNLQRALDLYDKDRHSYLASIYGSDHAETCASFLSLTKWVQGAADAAIRLQDWAVEHSRAINHTHSLARAYAYRSFLNCLNGNLDGIVSDARAALALSTANDLKLMQVFSVCLLATADTMRAETEKETAALIPALDGLHAVAPNALKPYFLTVAALAYRRLGLVEAGLALVDQAEDVIRQTTERWAMAEVYRVRAALLREMRETALAERCLRVAIKISVEQTAVSWLSRAGSDLMALLQEMGRFEEVHEIRQIADLPVTP
jgi:class 3 adenylate cyclase/tetratricopeptide (TPR) repeat protein